MLTVRLENCALVRHYTRVQQSWGPFLERPEKFSDPESYNKNLKP